MSTININFTETDGNVLDEADLDVIQTAVEELINITKFTGDNFTLGSLNAFKVATSTFDSNEIQRSVGRYQINQIDLTKVRANSLSTSFSTITKSERPARGVDGVSGEVQVLTLPGSVSISGSTSVSIFSGSITHTTTRGLVEIGIMPYANSSGGGTSSFELDGADDSYVFELERDGVIINAARLRRDIGGVSHKIPPGITFYDKVANGTYDYELKVKNSTGVGVIVFHAVSMVVRDV